MEADELVQQLQAAPKYRHVDEDLLRTTAENALARASNSKQALKFAKARLHQTITAYHSPKQAKQAKKTIKEIRTAAGMEPEIDREILLGLMSLHASTAERIPHLERFYSQIWEITGVPDSILDIACGFHPLARPWMGLPESSRYLAMDIDAAMMETVGRIMATLGPGRATVANALTVEPPETELTFLLKALPCFEQHQRGSAAKVLGRLRSKWIVVSFPTKSLGGRGGKGMAANYERQFYEWLEASGREAEVVRVEVENEIVFVCLLSPDHEQAARTELLKDEE